MFLIILPKYVCTQQNAFSCLLSFAYPQLFLFSFSSCCPHDFRFDAKFTKFCSSLCLDLPVNCLRPTSLFCPEQETDGVPYSAWMVRTSTGCWNSEASPEERTLCKFSGLYGCCLSNLLIPTCKIRSCLVADWKQDLKRLPGNYGFKKPKQTCSRSMLFYFPEVIDEVAASMPPLILYFSREKKKV